MTSQVGLPPFSLTWMTQLCSGRTVESGRTARRVPYVLWRLLCECFALGLILIDCTGQLLKKFLSELKMYVAAISASQHHA